MTKPRDVCTGPLSRRSFLQAGMLGLSGLGLSDFLRLRAEGNSGQRMAHDTAVILVWLPGGMSHIDTYDMKPNAPTRVPRRVSSHPDRGAWAGRLRVAARARQGGRPLQHRPVRFPWVYSARRRNQADANGSPAVAA